MHYAITTTTVHSIWQLYLKLLAQQLECGGPHNPAAALAARLRQTLAAVAAAETATGETVATLTAADWGSCNDVFTAYGMEPI
jgi:hypothetical protein